MASYNARVLSGFPSLIVEGIAVDPEVQGQGVFKAMTDIASKNEAVVCLRTQNPRMYRALEKYCSRIYPTSNETPEAIKAIREDLADHLDCSADEKGIVRRFYGGLFYGETPIHETTTLFFNEFGIDLDQGDALLAVGIR